MIPKLINDAEFQKEVIDSNQDVLVDFFAEWCGPCKTVDKILDTIGAERNGTLKIVKMDVMQSHKTASSYMISTLPTVMFFRAGRPLEQKVGLRAPAEYDKMIDQ